MPSPLVGPICAAEPVQTSARSGRPSPAALSAALLAGWLHRLRTALKPCTAPAGDLQTNWHQIARRGSTGRPVSQTAIPVTCLRGRRRAARPGNESICASIRRIRVISIELVTESSGASLKESLKLKMICRDPCSGRTFLSGNCTTESLNDCLNE